MEYSYSQSPTWNQASKSYLQAAKVAWEQASRWDGQRDKICLLAAHDCRCMAAKHTAFPNTRAQMQD